MSEKVALVTGSSSGIGLLTAVELARAGFRVVATMRDLGRRAKLEETAATAGVTERLEVRRLDVCESNSLPRVVEEVVSAHGRIDVLVNNAGYAAAGFAEDMLLEELRRQMETNFFAAVAMTKAVLPVMRRQRCGHIIQVSSISGRCGQPGISSYTASKFALEGWSEALRVEVRALGIQVVLVEPGSFKTDIWTRNVQIGRMALDPSSPNKERAQRFAEVVKSHAPQMKEPWPVARLIARIAQDPNPRLRYVIGSDASLQRWLRAVLPWKLYEKLIARALKMERA